VPRARKGAARRTAKNRVLKAAKGYKGSRSKQYRTAKSAVIRAEAYATRDRRQKKRQMRSLWITRLSAAARLRDLTYSRMMALLKKASIAIDRKMLAELAVSDGEAFDRVLEAAQTAG